MGPLGLGFVDKSGVVHICYAGDPAPVPVVEVMVVEVVEQFPDPFNCGVVFDIESFVTYSSWIFHQKRRLAFDFLVKGIKQFILNAVVVRIIYCVASAFEARVSFNMLVSGDFGFVCCYLGI